MNKHLNQTYVDDNILNLEDGLKLKIEESLGSKLLEVEEIIHDFTNSNVSIMKDLMNHILSSRGKRLRPVLLLLSGSFQPANDYVLIRAAAAVELIHTASLIHDDIIDESYERRGSPSLNARWGNRPAVLAGDFLFARAFELISLCQDFQLNKSFMKAIGTMCEGEIEQNVFAFNVNISEEQYLKNIYRKTAVLMEACCGEGARLSRLEGKDVSKLQAYGRNLGLAFQITDDILDIIGKSEFTGKPIGKDLQEGIITLPLIYVLEDITWGPRLKEVIENRAFSSENIDFLFQPSCIDGPLARAMDKAASFVREARESLAGFENTHARQILEEFADFVLQRDH
ncbi:MAG: polyprenyl synthetase family protein [Bacillota bacterium]|nr:polyprenyl synthetase family protein [Bacillota bacterium]